MEQQQNGTDLDCTALALEAEADVPIMPSHISRSQPTST